MKTFRQLNSNIYYYIFYFCLAFIAAFIGSYMASYYENKNLIYFEESSPLEVMLERDSIKTLGDLTILKKHIADIFKVSDDPNAIYMINEEGTLGWCKMHGVIYEVALSFSNGYPIMNFRIYMNKDKLTTP